MRSTSLRLHSGNLQLAANTFGNSDQTPVMLVHGYPDDSHTWHKLVPLLVAKGFYVITYDVRGSGRSDTPRSLKHYGMRYLMADIFNVIRATSPARPVHLVGHDWGSIQSWEAVTEPGADELLASFTTISGPCLDHVGMGLQKSFSENPADSVNQLLHSWYIGMFHLPVLPVSVWKLGLDRAWPALIRRTERLAADPSPLQQRNGVNGINLYRANMLPHLLQPRERFAQVPVLCIAALRDSYVTAAVLRDQAAWADNYTREEIDTTHWGPLLGEPETTAKYITDFINRLESGAPKTVSSGA